MLGLTTIMHMTDLTTDERKTILHALGPGESAGAQQGRMRRYAEPREFLPYPLYCVTARAAGRKEDMVGKQ